MAELIAAWSPPGPSPQYSPFYSDAEWTEISVGWDIEWDHKVQDWTLAASLDWLDRLIGFITEPPDLTRYCDQFRALWNENLNSDFHGTMFEGKVFNDCEVDGETWSGYLVEALATWGRREPTLVLGRIGPQLCQKQERETFIDVVANMNCVMTFLHKHASLPWLRPVVERASELDEAETIRLADALDTIPGDEARQLLLTLRQAIPPTQIKTLEGLDKRIAYQVTISASVTHN